MAYNCSFFRIEQLARRVSAVIANTTLGYESNVPDAADAFNKLFDQRVAIHGIVDSLKWLFSLAFLLLVLAVLLCEWVILMSHGRTSPADLAIQFRMEDLTWDVTPKLLWIL